MSTFNPNAGGEIQLTDAITMVKKYQANYPGEVKAHYFGKSIINTVLTQPNAVGIRIYQAINNNSERQLVLVGVDINGNDLPNGKLGDLSAPCPSVCDINSPFTK